MTTNNQIAGIAALAGAERARTCTAWLQAIPLVICNAPIEPTDLCAERLGGESYWRDTSRACGLHEFASVHRMTERQRRRGAGHDFIHGWKHVEPGGTKHEPRP